MTRLDALIALAALPDPQEMGPRRHQVTQPGDPKRLFTVLPALLVRWMVTRQVEKEPEPWIAPAKPARVRRRAA